MGAINSNDLSKFVGILEVAPIASPSAFVRLASVRGLISNLDNTVNAVDIKADDTGTVFKGFLPEGRIEGSFLENANRDILKLLMGGSESSVAGVLVAGASQVIASPFIANNFYEITNQNGSGAIIVVNSVTGSVDGALVANDDYHLVLDPDTGKYGIVLNTVAGGVTITTLAQTITINYDYTPNASESVAFAISFTESPRLVVRITATDTTGLKTRKITIDDATFEGIYGMEFLDVVEAGDLTGTSFTFKASKGATVTYYNEIL